MHSNLDGTAIHPAPVFFFSLALFFLSLGVVQSTPAGTGELKLLFSNNMAGEHLACG